MSEPAAEPTPSLIQQRLALGRRKILALIMTIGWGMLTIPRLIFLDVTNPLDWLVAAGSVALFITGGVLLIGYRRDVRAFEERYGRNAGRQK